MNTLDMGIFGGMFSSDKSNSKLINGKLKTGHGIGVLTTSSEVSHQNWMPFVQVETAEAVDVHDWLNAAQSASSRGHTARMAKCLQIASDIMKNLVMKGNNEKKMMVISNSYVVLVV